MTFLTHTVQYATGVTVTLCATGVTEQVHRCYLTDRPGEYYMDLAGTGRNEATARVALRMKVASEVKRLEANGNLKPSQARRLAFLKKVYL